MSPRVTLYINLISCFKHGLKERLETELGLPKKPLRLTLMVQNLGAFEASNGRIQKKLKEIIDRQEEGSGDCRGLAI